MDDLVALCKRRGFIYPASEIYGGINGFWDYGPLGVLLKNNLRDKWWRDMVLLPPAGPDGERLQIVGIDSSIIQNPKAWVASGHVGGFNDPMVDCKSCKSRYRADHLMQFVAVEVSEIPESVDGLRGIDAITVKDGKRLVVSIEANADVETTAKQIAGSWGVRKVKFKKAVDSSRQGLPGTFDFIIAGSDLFAFGWVATPEDSHNVPLCCPKCGGPLTEPRDFNLMFSTRVGATASEDDEDNTAYLRPETAQGIFLNYKNVVDTTRVRMPFGIAQQGKAFRNEVTPRNFIFRSREFEQMEMEWFCHPDEAAKWFEFWQHARLEWWKSCGVSGENLIMRQHDTDELSHYAQAGCGTADVEYRYPFTAPGYGELEGVAHRTDFDLRAHQEHSKAKMEYFDQERNERYVPHVIEPASGLSRGVLVLLCEAFTPDPDRPSKVYMRFAPEMAPIKAAVYPLVNKDGMPEIAERLHAELTRRFGTRGLIEFDAKQNIGKRYARMDEAGTPFCFTVDGDTPGDQAVTVRHRDTLEQERIAIDRVPAWLGERLGG
jgi:glycyl-tRNA synthetase